VMQLPHMYVLITKHTASQKMSAVNFPYVELMGGGPVSLQGGKVEPLFIVTVIGGLGILAVVIYFLVMMGQAAGGAKSSSRNSVASRSPAIAPSRPFRLAAPKAPVDTPAAPAPSAPTLPVPAAAPALPVPAAAPVALAMPVPAPTPSPSSSDEKPETVLQPLGIKTALHAARTLPRARALASAKPTVVQPRIAAVENGAQGVSRPTERRMGTSGKVMSLFSRQPDELDKRDVDVATRGFPSMEEGDHETSSSHDNMMRKYSFENFREAMMRGSPKSILGGDEEDEVSSSERIWRSTGHTRAAYERHVQPLARQMRASGSRADESASTNEALAAALL